MADHFIYLFDPLCGWCYGASAGIAALAAKPGTTVEALPTGLFADDGARTLDPAMTSHILASDKRIAALTGAVFGEAYSEYLANADAVRIDSGAATLALSAVAQTVPDREIEALGIIQRARYVDGRDIADPALLADLLVAAGLADAAALLAHATPALSSAHQARLQRAKSLMRQFGLSGVPSLLRDEDGALTPVDTSILLSPTPMKQGAQ